MEAVLLIGIQASGKTSLYRALFADTHLRLSLDVLRTRRREAILLGACLEAGQRLVVDNTNATRAERARTIAPARAARYCVIGYYLDVPVAVALARNALRTGRARVPDRAIWATAARLEPPTLGEGFRAIYRASPTPDGAWAIDLLAGEASAGA